MSTLSCRFCAHRNPPGAKFCSDCGSPLALKPCPKCEAITDVDAECCHQCGAPFDTAVATEAAAEAPSPVQQTGDTEVRAGAAGVPRESVHVPESLANRLGGEAAARPNDVKV
jgi:ribosomal protein L40E